MMVASRDTTVVMKASLRLSLLATASLGTLLSTTDVSAQNATCTAPTTTCGGTNGYYASKEDVDRVTAVAGPILRELRTCLDASGGKAATPAFVIRWDTEGNPVSVKVDVPGFESLPCVAKASGKLSTLQNPRETAIRCEYGCPKPAAPPPAQPPLVVQPPSQAPAPVVGQPQTQAPAAVPVLAPPPAHLSSVRYEKVWYGWQGLITDAVAYSLTLGGGFGDMGGVLATGLITFVLATPIIHMAHGNIGKGFGSMGMRVGLPAAGALIGVIAGAVVAGSNKSSSDSFGRNVGDAVGTGALVGSLLGGAGCVVIDAAALAYTNEKIEGPATASLARRTSTVRLVPTLDVRSDRAALGIGGTF